MNEDFERDFLKDVIYLQERVLELEAVIMEEINRNEAIIKVVKDESKGDIQEIRDISPARIYVGYDLPFEDDSTGPEQNIGPEFRAENVKKLLPGETATSTKKRSGEWEKGFNKAKAEAQEPTGPKFKKGGSVGSASRRGDGCATKGKTRGRMV